MSVFKRVISIVLAVLALAGIAVGIYYAVNRFILGKKKIFCHPEDDENFFECPCDEEFYGMDDSQTDNAAADNTAAPDNTAENAADETNNEVNE